MNDSADATTPMTTAAVTTERAAVAAAGHLGDETTARTGLASDSPTIRATALGALERMASLTDDDVETALRDPSPVVRRRAAELAAQHRSVSLDVALGDHDPTVVEMAAWSCGERVPGSESTVAALVSLARTHRDALVREAAVAALGALEHPDGLAAILAAMDDKPAIRRRAVIALTPFDGPEVTAAMERALTDRDWQVRQLAEDLSDR
ncbi:MAG: HEAT repeat domain-containing protein [Acidimicrobiia bacterium]